MISYGKQSINTADVKEVVKVLKSDFLTQGPGVLKFEEKIAKYCNTKYVVAVSNGTTALHLAYLVAGLKKGDEVITTPNTFVATSNMLLAVGAKPVFCDIRLDTYNIDEEKIEKLITKKTRAIVPVHFAGQACEMDKIFKIAKKHNLVVIEDGCHALGSKYKDQKIGSLKSDMTVFSFHPVKPITMGEGGVIVTNNKKYYEKLKLLRSHGVQKDKKGKNIMTELGYNYRITDIQCALGVSQLNRLDSFIKKRRQIVKWYQEELKDVEEIILPEEVKGNYSGWHLYVIRVKEKKNRDKLVNYLKKNNVGVNFHYPAVYSHPFYQENGYGKFKLEKEDEYQLSCITLPCYCDLIQKEVKYICNKIKFYFNNQGSRPADWY